VKKSILLSLLLANLLVWNLVRATTENELRVAFLDVGQGDAILIQAPAGGQVLVDGGRGRQVLEALSAVMPFGDEEIDLVIATHPDADHIGGLPAVLGRYRVLAIADIGLPVNTATYRLYEAALSTEVAAGAKRLPASSGLRVNLGDDWELLIISPSTFPFTGESNQGSVVASLIGPGASFLLMGDAPLQSEQTLLRTAADHLPAAVLKVGHHGSKTSTGETFLQAVSPHYAIISAGRSNP